MSRERSEHILQTTALVNEAYLRLADCNRMNWQDRAHFFAVSAQMMRRILVDHARRNNKKRGAGYERVSLEAVSMVSRRPSQNLVALDDALESLSQFEPAKRKSSSCVSSAVPTKNSVLTELVEFRQPSL